MTDHEGEPRLEDEEAGDRGLPLFWGVLLMAAVVAIAVWLFSQVDLAGGAADTTVGALETTVTEPDSNLDVLQNHGPDRSSRHTMNARPSNLGSASDGDVLVLVMGGKPEAGGQEPS